MQKVSWYFVTLVLDGALLLSIPRGICGLRRRVSPEEAQLFSIPLLKRKDGNFKGLIPVTHDANVCTNTEKPTCSVSYVSLGVWHLFCGFLSFCGLK